MRERWYRTFQGRKLPQKLCAAIEGWWTECPWTTEDVFALQNDVSGFLLGLGVVANIDTPPCQPFKLHLLDQIRTALGDRDTTSVPTLLQGVPLGIGEPIPASGIWKPAPGAIAKAAPFEFSWSKGNALSADEDPATVSALIQDDIAKGRLAPIHGGWEEACRRWLDRTAKGRFGLVEAPGTAPRLIGDSTIAGVNPSVVVLEKVVYHTPKDLVHTAPADEDRRDQTGLIIDVKGAHRTVRVCESDQGFLICEGPDRRFLHFTVCHFGGTFSAHWW